MAAALAGVLAKLFNIKNSISPALQYEDESAANEPQSITAAGTALDEQSLSNTLSEVENKHQNSASPTSS